MTVLVPSDLDSTCAVSEFGAKPPNRDNKDVCYADRDTLMRLVYEKYASKQKKDEDEIPPSSISVEQVLSEQNNPPSDRPHDIPEGAKLHNAPRPEELP